MPHSPQSFHDKLLARIQDIDSLLCVGIDPNPDQLPARFADLGLTFAEQTLAWNKSIIEDSAEFAAAFKPNAAFFEVQGEDGYSLLRATLDIIPPDIPVILDAKRGDIGSSSAAYAQAIFDNLGVDAVTLNAYLGQDSLQPFLDHADKGCFVLCRTSNPGSADFQELEISDWQTLDREQNQPLYIHVARRAVTWAPNVGLVVGATYPESLAAVRAVAPEAWFLVPGVGAQGGAIEATLEAGSRADGLGLIVNVSRGISLADEPGLAAQRYRDDLRRARQRIVHPVVEAPPAAGDVALEELCAGLVELGAVQFGTFTLASGLESPFYIDLRLLVSDPSLLVSAAQQYAAILDGLSADRIAGVPYAGLPIGTAVSLASGTPLIYPRKEVKEYGLQRGIEGAWNEHERVAVIEDVVTSGGSILRSVERMRDAGLVVEDAIVLLDREQGGVQNLAKHGVTVHCVLTMSSLLDSLRSQAAITQEQFDTVTDFILESQTG